MLWIRNYLILMLACIAGMAHAAPDFKEVETITVMSENSISLPMAQISSQFTRGRLISVSNNFGDSAAQKKKIEDGESADIFITSRPELVQELRTKGLVDVYSISKLVSSHNTSYTVAVIAGENMTPARVFLDFLKSDEAKALFTKNDFSVP